MISLGGGKRLFLLGTSPLFNKLAISHSVVSSKSSSLSGYSSSSISSSYSSKNEDAYSS
jgi:hypothetical protein